jgi:Ala-tRNA(Pro) deacylase
MIGQKIVYDTLQKLNINYKYFESPKDYSNEDDGSFWTKTGACRCKNLFLRNHKGDRHFLLIADYYKDTKIKLLEDKLKKGKISFASQKRIDKWIKGVPGAISVFSLFNDKSNHVEVFIDKSLLEKDFLTFLPNNLNALIVISREDFLRLLDFSGNYYEFIDFS